MYGSGREALWDARKWSGGPLECPVVFRRSSRMSGSSQKVLTEVREWWGCPPGCQ